MIKHLQQFGYYWLIIIFAVGISVITLSSQSIRLDEAQSIWVATKSVSEILHLDGLDVLVPLYELLLHFWMQIFGSSIFSARMLSFIFFCFTLPVLYKVAKETSNKRVAMITITLFSLSPFIMWYSSEARMYSLFAFVTTVNHLFFTRFLRSQGVSSKTGYLFTAIVGLYTHYFFLILLVSQLLYLLWKTIFKPEYEIGIKNELRHPHNAYLRLLGIHVILLIVAGIFFAPWIVYVLHLGGAVDSQPLIPPSSSFNIFQSFTNFLFGFQSSVIQSILISLWPIFVLSLFFIFTKREKQAGESVIYFAFATFLPVILIFLLSYFRPIFLSRYLILVTPTLFLLIAWIVAGYHKRLSGVIFGILFFVMFALLVYQNISTTTPSKENYAGVAMYLQRQAMSSDIIVVSVPFTIYPLEYVYHGNIGIDTIPRWDRYTQGAIPDFSEAQLKKQIASYKGTYQDIFVVLSYDQGYQKKIVQYLDAHLKRLSQKEFSKDLEVREYQLRY